MTYQEGISYLLSRLNYERQGMPPTRDLRLERVVLLLDLLGNPERKLAIVHVAGTKGKGSTAHLAATLLRAAGNRVGLHTSPHLLRLEERFLIDGEAPSEESLAGLIGHVADLVTEVDAQLTPEQPSLTFFEITTAMAFLYFAQHHVDWAVIEVGVGGRLDSTNVVEPRVAVITSIAKDHTRLLGDTLELIAREKAGIIKPGRPIVSGVRDPGPGKVIRQVAEMMDSPLFEIGRDFDFTARAGTSSVTDVVVQTWRERWPAAGLNLVGEHQAHNCAVAIAALDAVRDQWSGSTRIMADALKEVAVACRVEVLSRTPTVIVDVAHNDSSVQALVDSIPSIAGVRERGSRRALVFATSRDKDWKTMLTLLVPHFDRLFLTTYQSNPRALPAEEIDSRFGDWPLPVRVCPRPADAWDDACRFLGLAPTWRVGDPLDQSTMAGDKLLCVTGSFYLAAEVLALARRLPIPAPPELEFAFAP